MSLDNFESKLKELIEGYELTDSKPDWEDFEKKLDHSIKKSKYRKAALFVSGAVILFLSIFLISNKQNEVSHHEHLPKQGVTKVSEKEIFSKEVTKSEGTVDNDVQGDQQVVTPSSQQNLSPQTKSNSVVPDNREEINELNTRTTLVESKSIEHLPSNPDITISSKRQTTISAEFIVSKEKGCVNDIIKFQPVLVDKANTYSWNFGDGNVTSDLKAQHRYETAGEYTATLQVKRGAEIETYTKRISVFPAPTANINIIEPALSECEMKHKVIATHDGDYNLSWTIQNQTFNTDTVSYLFDQKGEFEISLRIKDHNNCESKAISSINIEKDYDLGAGNVLIVNNGEYGMWLPPHLQCDNVEFSLTVISRNNQVVFKSTNRENRWNGQLLGSTQFAKKGEFYGWKAVYKLPDGISRQTGGSIIIQ